jgi:uncharacterized protein YndB with AHSA1/START domain
MAEFQKAMVVNCTPEKAFAIVSDVTRHPEWATTKLEVQKTSEGEIAVGSTFHTTGYQFGKHEGEVRIVELVPNEKIVYESNDDAAHNRHSVLLAPAEGGTMITKSMQVLEAKSLLFKMASPMLGLIAPRGLQADLESMKQQLEA